MAVLWILFSAFQNGEYASLSAAIPDHVPVRQRATVAGWVGMPQALGLVVGTVLVVDVFTKLISGYDTLALLLVVAGGLLVIVGMVDDRWGLGAIAKLAAQIAASGIIVWSGVYLSWIPGAGGQTVSLEPDLSYTVTILIIVATINAVNFIDGLDGLASGIVGISAIAYLSSRRPSVVAAETS